jgi:transposase-like protein
MSQKRLVIDLSEILHLEIYCNACKNSSILPLEDQPKTGAGAGIYQASYTCTSCLKPFADVTGFKPALDKIREGLALHKSVQGEFAIRLVIQK